MNEEDSEQMALYLEQIGFSPVGSIREAQVVLLNTCSVRQKPEDKAFSLIGELRFLKERFPDTVIGVCGCMAQLRAEEIRRRAPHVDFVVGTGNLAEIPALVSEALQGAQFASRIELPERKGAVVTHLPTRHVGRDGKLKAYVPIQYGCDKFCTFCIVPTTRGRERSRPTEEILDEIKRLADLGTKEICLLGQTVNSYGKNLMEGKVPFSELLVKVAEVSGIERIRFTSPYPRDFRRDLIEVIRDVPQVMEHVHMPLQAGSNTELARMKRLYTLESFGEIVEEIRSMIPKVGITTDLIVGFPDETEEEFQATLATVNQFRFDWAFMFAYSPRPGTPAADWSGQIDEQTKKARLNELIDLQNSITKSVNEGRVGDEYEVLVEGTSPRNTGMMQGYSREFTMMHFEAANERVGRLAKVRATSAKQWGLVGELI
jgi:tRNA-2-methylthio-N6-dimethylallyladenosine synthase